MTFGYNNQGKEELEKLEEALQRMNVPVLDASEKQALFSGITDQGEQSVDNGLPRSLQAVASFLRKSRLAVKIPVWASVMMRERVLGYAEENKNLANMYANSWLKPIYSGTAFFVAIIFVGTTILFPFKGVPQVLAHGAYVGNIQGDVKVKRDHVVFPAQEHMVLQAGDVVITSNGARATVHFLDASVTRLDSNTALQLKRIEADALDPFITHVNVAVDEGRIWARVVDLDKDDSFAVETSSMLAQVRYKAALDVKADAEATEIAVYDNMVEVADLQDSQSPPKTVIAGYKVATGEDSRDISVQKLSLQEQGNNLVDQEDWVALNLSHDRDYAEGFVQEKEKKIVEAAPDVANLVVAGESDLKALLGDDNDDLLKQIRDAYDHLLSARVQLVRGATREGQDHLQDFRKDMDAIIVLLDELETTSPEQAATARALLQKSIGTELKDLAPFGADNRLYRAKEALQSVQVNLVVDDVQKAEVELAQAGNVLLEMQDLVDQDKLHLASTLLKRYQNRANSFSLELTEENDPLSEGALEGLMEEQVSHMKALTTLENAIVNRDQFAFRDELRAVRADTLRKFLLALEETSHDVPNSVVAEVRSLYDDYIEEEDEEEALLNAAMEKFLDTPYIDAGEAEDAPLEDENSFEEEVLGVELAEDDESDLSESSQEEVLVEQDEQVGLTEQDRLDEQDDMLLPESDMPIWLQ